MPRILFPRQTTTLANSQSSLSSGRRSSSSWSQYHGKSSGSSNLYEVGLRRSLVERSSINSNKSSKGQYSSSSSVSPLEQDYSNSSENEENTASHDDWGFFVDISPHQEQEQTERRFLNGYDSVPARFGGGLGSSQRNVLKSIPDTGL